MEDIWDIQKKKEVLLLKDEDILRFSKQKVKPRLWKHSIYALVSITAIAMVIVFMVTSIKGMSNQEFIIWYQDIKGKHIPKLFLLLVLFVRYLWWLKKLYRDSKIILDEGNRIKSCLRAVSGEVTLIEIGGRYDPNYYFEIEPEASYYMGQYQNEFIENSVEGKDNFRFVMPKSMIQDVHIFSKLLCIYGDLSGELYDLRIIDTIEQRTYEKNTYCRIKKLETLQALPSLYGEIKKEYEDQKNLKIIFGTITYANADGNVKEDNIHWMIDIRVKEYCGMEIDHPYEREKTINFGQDPKDCDSKYDLYEVEETLEFQRYFDHKNRYRVGDKVIGVLGYKGLKLKKVYKI